MMEHLQVIFNGVIINGHSLLPGVEATYYFELISRLLDIITRRYGY